MNFKFSGHETFPCRYTWLPKAVRGLIENKNLFAEEDAAMVKLGVGKNMVRAIRFWTDAAAVSIKGATRTDGLDVSPFGRRVLGEGGFDEFLEDIKTLWLIHWNFSTNFEEPLFAWHFMLNYWHRSDFTRAEALEAFHKEAQRLEKALSPVTLEHHFTTFLHTYFPTRSKKGDVLEDNLDCPLVELELIQKVGERSVGSAGRREPIYAFRVEEKPEITSELFIYCLADYWERKTPNDKTLSFRQIAVGEGSPGQIFKLPEKSIRDRLESIQHDSAGVFSFQDSATHQQVMQHKKLSREQFLERVYRHHKHN